MNSLGILLKCRFRFQRPREEPETAFLISNPPPQAMLMLLVQRPHCESKDVEARGAVKKSCGPGVVSPCWACFAFQNEMLEEGHEYAVMLYTWRSCSRAIPQVSPAPRGTALPSSHPHPGYWPSPGYREWSGVSYPRVLTEHVQRASHEADANFKKFLIILLFWKQYMLSVQYPNHCRKV